GWGAILAAAASAVWTAYQAAPSSKAKDSAEAEGTFTHIVFQVAPYLVLIVLALLLALAGHFIIAELAKHPSLSFILSNGVIAGALLLSSSRRGSPAVGLRRYGRGFPCHPRLGERPCAHLPAPSIVWHRWWRRLQ